MSVIKATNKQELFDGLMSVDDTVILPHLFLLCTVGTVFEVVLEKTISRAYIKFDDFCMRILIEKSGEVVSKEFFLLEEDILHRENDLPALIYYRNGRVTNKKWYINNVNKRADFSEDYFVEFTFSENSIDSMLLYRFPKIENKRFYLSFITILEDTEVIQYYFNNEMINFKKIAHLFEDYKLESVKDFFELPLKCSEDVLNLIEIVKI